MGEDGAGGGDGDGGIVVDACRAGIRYGRRRSGFRVADADGAFEPGGGGNGPGGGGAGGGGLKVGGNCGEGGEIVACLGRVSGR